MDGVDEPVDATMVIEVGTCFSVFLRIENFTESKNCGLFNTQGFETENDMLPANCLMALVLGSNNINQAEKGMGVKFRKGKQVDADSMLTVFAGIPQREEDADVVLARSKNQVAVQKMVFRGSMKVFWCRPDALSHATKDTKTGELVLCNVALTLPEVFFSVV